MEFSTAILFNPKFWIGTELKEFRFFFDENAVRKISLKIHWWKEAKEEFESGIPRGYSRKGDDHKIITVEFSDVENIRCSILEVSNGDQIHHITTSDEEGWVVSFVDGTQLVFSCFGYAEVAEIEDCDQSGYTD